MMASYSELVISQSVIALLIISASFTDDLLGFSPGLIFPSTVLLW
jgi:hypothetical protein